MPYHFILNFISTFIKIHTQAYSEKIAIPYSTSPLTISPYQRQTHLIILVVYISKESAYMAIFSILIIIYWLLIIKGKDIALSSPYPHYCSPIFRTWLYHEFCFNRCSRLCYISKFCYDYVKYCSLSYMTDDAADSFFLLSNFPPRVNGCLSFPFP